MKKMFFILSLFLSCKPTVKYADRSALTLSDADRIKNLEIIVASLIKDTVLKSKQIVALKKNDSIYNLKVNSEATKLKNFMYVFSSDSIKQWVQIKKVYPLVSIFPKDSIKQWKAITTNTDLTAKVTALDSRYRNDSVKHWNAINTVTPLIPKVASLKSDSAKQWVEINKLKSASPVTQIPIMQKDIKDIKAKNVLQDQVNVTQSALIENLYDTIEVLKIFPSSDFGLDATGKFFMISPQGMIRIKATIQPQP